MMLLKTKQRLTDQNLTKMVPPKALVMFLAKMATTFILNLSDATLSSSCFKMHPIRCL